MCAVVQALSSPASSCAPSPPGLPGCSHSENTDLPGHKAPSPLDPRQGDVGIKTHRLGLPCSPLGGTRCLGRVTAAVGVGSMGVWCLLCARCSPELTLAYSSPRKPGYSSVGAHLSPHFTEATIEAQ